MSRKQISGNPDPTADGDRDFFCCEEGLVQARPFRVQLEGKRQHLLFFPQPRLGLRVRLQYLREWVIFGLLPVVLVRI